MKLTKIKGREQINIYLNLMDLYHLMYSKKYWNSISSSIKVYGRTMTIYIAGRSDEYQRKRFKKLFSKI